MKTFPGLKKSKGPRVGLGFNLLILILSSVVTLDAKEKWSINTALVYSTGKYIYSSNVDKYTVYLGGKYSKDIWNITVTVPFILQRDNLNFEPVSNFSTSGSMNNYTTTFGMADVYFYGEYTLNNYLFLTGQIKLPTASRITMFSTGEFDFGAGIAFRKMIGTYKLFVDFGFTKFGNTEQLNYNNPLNYGIGIAKYFPNMKSSVSLYYNEYGTIINGLDAPKQISAGYFKNLFSGITLGFYVAKGFGESSPDFTFSLGTNITLN
jgi:hypothetical protein